VRINDGASSHEQVAQFGKAHKSTVQQGSGGGDSEDCVSAEEAACTFVTHLNKSVFSQTTSSRVRIEPLGIYDGALGPRVRCDNTAASEKGAWGVRSGER